MAVRTTKEEVKKIIDVSTETSDDSIDSMIATANLIVNSNLVDEGLSDTILTEIEKYLTCHLLSMTLERQPERIEIGGDTSEQYPKLGKGLEMTTYGQMVITLDTTGKLKNLGLKKAVITAVESFDD